LVTIRRIRQGRVRRILERVEQAILSIQRPSLAHGCKVPAWATRRLLFILIREGFEEPELARRLGLHAERLQYLTRRRVTVRTALRVRAFYQRATAEAFDDSTEPITARCSETLPGLSPPRNVADRGLADGAARV
jgi:hypothetical protein